MRQIDEHAQGRDQHRLLRRTGGGNGGLGERDEEEGGCSDSDADVDEDEARRGVGVGVGVRDDVEERSDEAHAGGRVSALPPDDDDDDDKACRCRMMHRA